MVVGVVVRSERSSRLTHHGNSIEAISFFVIDECRDALSSSISTVPSSAIGPSRRRRSMRKDALAICFVFRNSDIL